MLATFILAAILVMNLFSDFVGSLFDPAQTHRQVRGRSSILEEVVVENNRARENVLVIDIAGLITSAPWDGRGRSLVSSIADQLAAAEKDARVKAVIVRVDSPGGEVLASDEISRSIAQFQEKSGKPVVASMGSLAASGGYYVLAGSRWIVANELTLTGSIGVLMHTYNYRGLMDKVGVRPVVFKSGRFKDMLSGDRHMDEVPPEERSMLQALIDQTYQRFKEVVANGRESAGRRNQDRGRPLDPDWSTYADGRVLSGKQAYEVGLVDELGNFQTAFRRALKLTGLADANLIKYQEPFDLGNILRLFGKTESRSVKLELGLDLPALQAGRLYFLSPNFLH
jgi:protease-4